MAARPTCDRCHRPVIEARTRPAGRPILLDPEPTEAGVYQLNLDALPSPVAWRVRSGDEPIHLHGPLYTCHWDTCPAAKPESAPAAPEAFAR